jgi:hypothetical protein
MLKKFYSNNILHGVIMLIAGLMGLSSSIMLTLEAYWSSLSRSYIPSCDINATISCSKVAASWQAALLNFQGRPIPNSIIGIPVFTVICFVGFLYAFKIVLPRIVKILMWLLVAVMFSLSGWLLFQSYYSIHAFCPWCLFMDFGVVIILLESFIILNISKRKARLEVATDKIEHVDKLIPFDEWKQKLNKPNKIAKK